MKIFITENGGGPTVRVSGEPWLFDLALDRFRQTIPPSARSFDGSRRQWSIDPRYCNRLEAWAESMRNDYDAEILRDSPPAPDPPTSLPSYDPYEILHLLPTAPPQLVEASYRTLSKIHHPDHGGDPEIMRRLNLAHDEIVSRLKYSRGREDVDFQSN